MIVEITPKKLSGTVSVISSKSYAHRIITAALLSDKPTMININGYSEDILSTIACARALGCETDIKEKSVTVYPGKRVLDAVLDCGESGTTARIMLPVATVCADSAEIIGKGRLPERPFAEMTELLRARGSIVDSDVLPIAVKGSPRGGDFPIAGNISSQYITGLMFALPLLDKDSTITLTTPLKSSAYVDITIDVLKQFGINVRKTATGYAVPMGRYVSPSEAMVEGDWSNGAFWIVAEYLGSDLKIENLNPKSVQGDKKICDILCDSEIDVDEIPDLFPILAVLATGKKGKTRLYNAARLRLKESDRIESVYNMLINLGADAEKGEDYLTVYGSGTLSGGTVDSCNDHRIVMSAAIAATIATDKVVINGAEAVNKSYPSFFDEYKKLGGDINVI